MRKPFFKKSHQCWYVRQGNVDVRLDPDEEKAFRLWHQMRELKNVSDRSSFAVLAEAYLQEHQPLMTSQKFDQVAGYIATFLPFASDMTCLEVSPGLVAKWLAAEKPGRLKKDGSRGKSIIWKQTTRRDAASALKRVYRWAHGTGKISRNPLFGLKVAEGAPRTVMVSDSAHRMLVTELLKIVDDRPFALYLIASQCGARPKQIREVTPANVLADYSAWVFEDHKTVEHTGKRLVVYLPPCLATLTRILTRWPQGTDGRLFAQSMGQPWTRFTVGQRMRRLRKRLNLPKDLVVYGYRHTFATEALLAGNHIATVAELMGHTSTRMVSKVYGHLDQHKKHLSDAVARAAARRFAQ